jgi:hypothetical protein
VIDWASRAVLSWPLWNTMDAAFCVAALEEALARQGKPEIFNTDQGSQFTGSDFTSVLIVAGWSRRFAFCAPFPSIAASAFPETFADILRLMAELRPPPITSTA